MPYIQLKYHPEKVKEESLKEIGELVFETVHKYMPREDGEPMKSSDSGYEAVPLSEHAIGYYPFTVVIFGTHSELREERMQEYCDQITNALAESDLVKNTVDTNKDEKWLEVTIMLMPTVFSQR